MLSLSKAKTLLAASLLATVGWAGAASAVTVTFDNITNNGNPDIASQLVLEVVDVGDGAQFTFSGRTYVAIDQVTLGTFLVGLGWAAANVAATALIADHAETAERGRAIGVADSVAGAISVLTALVTGPVIARLGMPAAGATAVALAVVPLVMWLIDRRGD